MFGVTFPVRELRPVLRPCFKARGNSLLPSKQSSVLKSIIFVHTIAVNTFVARRVCHTEFVLPMCF